MGNNLSEYIILVDFLSKILGPNTEIVLQSTAKNNEGIVYIVNGHISGRKKGDPLTDLSKKWLKDQVYLKENYKVHYLGKANFDQQILSSTFFIKKNNSLIGMLCFNMDTSIYKNYFNNLLLSLNIPLQSVFNNNNDEHNVIIENLHNTIDGQINDVLLKYNITFPIKKLTITERKEIIY